MSPLDAAIVAAFIAYVLFAGLRDRSRASGGLDQYFLAGRSLSGWQAGISMAATQFAADTPLLVTGLVAAGGIFALWRLWIYALAFLLLAFVLAACWRRAGVLTDAEFAELRYSGRGAMLLRLFKALYFGVIFNCTALAIVLLAAARLAEPFLPWDTWLPGALFEPVRALVERLGLVITVARPGDPEVWTRSAANLISILCIALLTLAYSTLGGLRAVVKTDVVQFFIMMVASLGYAGIVVYEAGGFGAMIERLRAAFETSVGPVAMSASQLLAFTPSAARDVGAALMTVILLQWLIQMNADGTGYLAQRAMACRDDRQARIAAVVFTFAQVLVRSLIWLPIALGLLLIFPPGAAEAPALFVADRESTFVRGIDQLLPMGLKGLMLTGMMAALASTVDTHLNWGAAYLTNDIYKRFVCEARGRVPSARVLVWVARGANILLLALALVVMARLGSIRAAWEASLLLGAGVGIVLVLRWLWWRVTAWGELSAVASSALVVPAVLLALPDEQAALRMLIVALASTGAAIAISLWVRPPRPEALLEFYRKVRPPGAWGAVARLAGEDARAPARRLGRDLAATLLASLTVFGLLVGIGTWMLGATPPSWLPQRDAWAALNLAVGLIALPLWVRLGFRREPGV